MKNTNNTENLEAVENTELIVEIKGSLEALDLNTSWAARQIKVNAEYLRNVLNRTKELTVSLKEKLLKLKEYLELIRKAKATALAA